MALYREIYRVIINHNYYTTGIPQDFSVEPTAMCQQQLQKQGMIFKVNGNELIVLAEATPDGSDYQLKKAIPDGTKFTFMLVNKTGTFLNYTHLPLNNNQNQFYYFCNLYDHQNAGDLLLYPVNTDHYIGATERITLFPDVFTMDFETTTQVKITDADSGNIVFNDTVTGIKEFDFSGTKNKKRYNVEFDSSGTTDLVLYIDSSIVSQQRLFGIVEIYQSTAVPSAYRFINATTDIIQNKRYSLRFDRRIVKWRYILELRYDADLIAAYNAHTLDIGISSTGQTYTEQSYSSTDIPRIVRFESDNQIPFSNVSLQGVVLNNDVSSTPVPVINNLPNPSTAMVIPSADYVTDDLVYSEIYIYV